MAQFLEKNANIVYTVLVNDDYTVNYDLLKVFTCISNKYFSDYEGNA